MLPELSEIKARRKQLGMTQGELAELAKVSQSLIAKIENNAIMPTYDRVKRIFDVLSAAQRRKTVLAKDVMKKKVLFVSAKIPVKKAVALMRKNAVSQIPVIEREKVIGTLSEKEILHQMEEAQDWQEFGKRYVQDVMQEAMPLVQENLPHQVISSLLDYHPAVLVGSRGKIKGIITKSDLLDMLGKDRRAGK